MDERQRIFLDLYNITKTHKKYDTFLEFLLLMYNGWDFNENDFVYALESLSRMGMLS